METLKGSKIEDGDDSSELSDDDAPADEFDMSGDGDGDEEEDFGTHDERFALMMENILGKRTRHEDAPILCATSHGQFVGTKEKKARRERKATREERKRRKALKEKDNAAPTVLIDEHERALLEIATKGVVKLFNAVTKAQRQADSNSASAAETAPPKPVSALSQSEFLQLLKGKGDSQSEEAEAAAVPRQAQPDDGSDASKPRWGALQDDFLVKKDVNLRDWDNSSEDENSDVGGEGDYEDEDEDEREEEAE